MVGVASITGVYGTRVGEHPNASALSLHADAALGAVADAGLTLHDIDGRPMPGSRCMILTA